MPGLVTIHGQQFPRCEPLIVGTSLLTNPASLDGWNEVPRLDSRKAGWCYACTSIAMVRCEIYRKENRNV